MKHPSMSNTRASAGRFRPFWPRIFRDPQTAGPQTAGRQTAEHQTAGDLAQEAHPRLSRAPQIGMIAHPDAFLHRAARNFGLDNEHQRRRRSRYEVRDASRR